MALTQSEILLLLGLYFVGSALTLVILTVLIKGWKAYDEHPYPEYTKTDNSLYVPLIEAEYSYGNSFSAKLLIRVWWSHLSQEKRDTLEALLVVDEEQDYVDYMEHVYLTIYPQKQPPCDPV